MVLLPLKSNLLYLTALRTKLLPRDLGSAALRGNCLRGQATTAPLVEALGLLGCQFDHNDGEQTGKGGLIGSIAADHVGGSNNRMVCVGEADTLRLITKSFAVLGNLSTGPILVNGAPLPAPWNGLNVHI